MNKYAAQYENECYALGCLLHDTSLLDETTLLPSHFLDPYNKELFKLMKQMKEGGENPSVLSISQLGDTTLMKIGGSEWLNNLVGSVPSLSIFEKYQQHILDYHVIQKANEIANQFLDVSKERHYIKDLQEFLEDVTRLEVSTVRKNDSFKELLAERSLQHYSSPAKGLSGVNTGFMNINFFTDGWQPSDLIIVAARPSMGKTALVLNSILEGCKKDDIYATFFSIEMSKGQLVDRLIAMQGGINLKKMRNPNKTFTPEDWENYTKACGALEKLPLDIRDEYTVPTIRAAIKRNMKEHPGKKHVVAIDFLTLIQHQNSSGNSHKDLSDIIKDLKQICKDLNIPMVVLAQLNRGVEARQDKRPNMSDIGESGTIEQIADLIAFLYRDEYYNPETETPGITELIIAKNRNGSTGTVKLKFIKQTNVFKDVIMQ
jgi:replicative DNA helicase